MYTPSIYMHAVGDDHGIDREAERVPMEVYVVISHFQKLIKLILHVS